MKRATGLRIRDAEGKEVKTRIAEVMQQAKQARADLRRERERLRNERASGVSMDRMPSVRAPRSPASETAGGNRTVASPRALRLHDGIARAMIIGTGLFAIENGHSRDTRAALVRALTVLDGSMLCADVTQQHFVDVWRTLAARWAQEASALEVARHATLMTGDEDQLPPRAPRGGFVSTSRVIVALALALRWLRDRGHTHVGAIDAPRKWKTSMLADWRSITKDHTAGVVKRLRYTQAEAGRLFLALSTADPRFRFACVMAMENRLGAFVSRARRSDIVLEADDAFPLGRLTIHGSGTKTGVLIAFDAAARAEVDAVLSCGYLRQLEDLFTAGRIQNYLLFPGGNLPGGVANLDMTVPMNDRTLNDHWHRLEAAAGIEHIVGRGAYGLRRVSTDLTKKQTKTKEVLDDLLGHARQGVRATVYENPIDPERSAEATEVRRKWREHAIARAEAETGQHTKAQSSPSQEPPSEG